MHQTLFTARCYAERGDGTVRRLSVRLSVTFRYDFHTGWNTSEIISRLISLRLLLWLTPTWGLTVILEVCRESHDFGLSP